MWVIIAEALLRIIANYVVGLAAQITKELNRKKEHEEALKEVSQQIEDLEKKKENYIQIRSAMQSQVRDILDQIGLARAEYESARKEKEELINSLSEAEILRSQL
jgi:hypothetical protein